MNDSIAKGLVVLGAFLLVGLAAPGWLAGRAAIQVKTMERSVAEKFAADSQSSLGKIRSAQQGRFSIENRDGTTPHIKKVRVVSTVEYYLAD